VTGQWLRSDTGTPWFFDSGALSLDFAYLGGFRAGSRLGPESGFALPADGSVPWDGLLLTADLDDWVAERWPGVGAAASDRELADARALRDAVARLAVAATSTPSTCSRQPPTCRRPSRAADARRVRGGCGWVRPWPPSRATPSASSTRWGSAAVTTRASGAARTPSAASSTATSHGGAAGGGARCSAAATGPRSGRTGPVSPRADAARTQQCGGSPSSRAGHR
jgi:hypothetical protein